jgi:hypothetical protein
LSPKTRAAMKIKLVVLILALNLALVGCSSGGGSSDSSSEPGNAAINSANAKDLATAATEGAKLAADSDNVSQFGLKSASKATLENLTETVARDFALIPQSVMPNPCTGGGGVTIDTLPDGTFLLDYQLCDIAGIIADGVITLNSTVSGDITTVSLSYTSFSITIGTDTSVSSLTAVCTINNNTAATSCTYSSDIAGFDGRTYSISGLNVSGDSIAGYSVSATIIDPDHGIITISTTIPILFNCPNEQPSMGEIQFTDSAGVLVSVTFNDCDSFTVFYNGVATLYNW